MPCYHPLDAWQSIRKKSNGKSKIYVVGKSPYVPTEPCAKIKVPCGQCIGCRLLKSVVWATRIMHEASLHTTNSFITLTYSDKYIPEDYSLNKQHFVKFIKRFRKKLKKKTSKYATSCAENMEMNHGGLTTMQLYSITTFQSGS